MTKFHERRVAPGITRAAGICGGRPCIEGHRIEPWHLVVAAKSGGIDTIHDIYPHLTMNEIACGLAFAFQHPKSAVEPGSCVCGYNGEPEVHPDDPELRRCPRCQEPWDVED